MTAQYVARVLDCTGVMVWGNGFGDYITAENAAQAKAIAEQQFRDPGPVPRDPEEREFFIHVNKVRRSIIAHGFTVEVRRRRA